MADFSFSPRYRLYCRTGGQLWSLRTLQSAQCLLTTGQGVNQATFALADPDGCLSRTVAPKPMALVQLWTTNRCGEGGVVWTGYVDEVHKAFDPQAGNSIVLNCTGPVKLFEITRQSPADVAALAVAYVKNVAASSVLRFAAKACGYPQSLLNIHPLADAGSGIQTFGAGPFTQPDQQPWSGVISSIMASAGLEWFFDARGACFYRQINPLDPWFPPGAGRPPQVRPRTIGQDDILQADYAQSDSGIVTDVQVRWAGGGGFVQSAVNWPEHDSAAHKNMVAHLRTRRLVVYAPWLYNKAAAQYLAQVLYLQYSSGVAQGSLTVPADPLIEVGSLVDVPALGAGGTTRYYVTSVTYQLAWGGAWVMTLTLAYGHAPNESFPYTGTQTWPKLSGSLKQGVPQATAIGPWNASNPFWDDTPYDIVATSGLRKDQAAIQSDVYPAGSVIWIYTQPHSKGKHVGPAPIGEYTVVPPTSAAQPDGTIALASTKDSVGYVTVKRFGPALWPEVGSGAGTGLGAAKTTLGTGTSAGPVTQPGVAALGPAPTIALRALAAALTLAGQPYAGGHAGPDAWDCSGLVSWAYAQLGLGVGQMFFATAALSGWNTDSGPPGIYSYMKGLGATDIDPASARKGDLLFCRSDDHSFQDGFGHVAFALGDGTNFGANPPIGVTPIAGFYGDNGAPFNYALDLSTVSSWPSST